MRTLATLRNASSVMTFFIAPLPLHSSYTYAQDSRFCTLFPTRCQRTRSMLCVWFHRPLFAPLNKAHTVLTSTQFFQYFYRLSLRKPLTRVFITLPVLATITPQASYEHARLKIHGLRAGCRAMVEVSDAQQRPAGRSIPPDLPILREAPALQKRGAPVQQDDLRALDSALIFTYFGVKSIK